MVNTDKVPGPPIILDVTPGYCYLTVSFEPAPPTFWQAWFGQMTSVTGYVVKVMPDNRQIYCSSSPCTISGLTNGRGYKVSVMAENGVGRSDWSEESYEVVPGE